MDRVVVVVVWVFLFCFLMISVRGDVFNMTLSETTAVAECRISTHLLFKLPERHQIKSLKRSKEERGKGSFQAANELRVCTKYGVNNECF